jgi:hypothetical protein
MLKHNTDLQIMLGIIIGVMSLFFCIAVALRVREKKRARFNNNVTENKYKSLKNAYRQLMEVVIDDTQYIENDPESQYVAEIKPQVYDSETYSPEGLDVEINAGPPPYFKEEVVPSSPAQSAGVEESMHHPDDPVYHRPVRVPPRKKNHKLPSDV